MNIIDILTLIKSIPDTAASNALAAATRAEAAADIAENYGWTMTCSDVSSNGNIVITKSN